jgi:O-methyltransferase involved in polyketide biosynthesis
MAYRQVPGADLDLPDVIELRRQFLADGVLAYLNEPDVHRTLAAIVDRFPGSLLAFDTCGQKVISGQDRHDSLSKMTARMRWACDTPRHLDQVGLTLRESRTLAETHQPVRQRLDYRQRLMLNIAARLNLRGFASYRVNLFQAIPTP